MGADANDTARENGIDKVGIEQNVPGTNIHAAAGKTTDRCRKSFWKEGRCNLMHMQRPVKMVFRFCQITPTLPALMRQVHPDLVFVSGANPIWNIEQEVGVENPISRQGKSPVF